MTVTKTYCDRCVKEVIYPVERKLFLSGDGREGGYDLCNSCYDELRKWFIFRKKITEEGDVSECKALEQQPCEQRIFKMEERTSWISVRERLPEDIKPVIVTWKNTDPKSYYQYIVGKHFLGTAHYKDGKWFWYSSVTEDLLAEYGRCDSEEFDEAIEVIAWMPLPQPYKAESEDKE